MYKHTFFHKTQSNSQMSSMKMRGVSKTDTFVARDWVQLGIRFAQKCYYFKAFLSFGMALSLDRSSMEARHSLIQRYIQTGRLQDANELALKMGGINTQREPWVFA